MRSLRLPAFRPLQEGREQRNAVVLFLLTMLLYFIGSALRLGQELSLFWPLNGVMAGLFARYAWLNRLNYYAVCYTAMLACDAITTEWGRASLVINLSNILFIIIVARLAIRDRRRQKCNYEPFSALRLFNYCLLAALCCALPGAFASPGRDGADFWPLFADWFSEQFSTGVLIVPCMLTLALPRAASVRRLQPGQLLPVLALIVSVLGSVIIGGAGSLAFPLPALIWCAVRYPLQATCLLTFLTGALEMMLVASSVITISVASPLLASHMFSARLGIATMAICPVMVAVSVAAIGTLMKQLSLRADFDFLTQVYSRSGLFEALKKQTCTHSQHVTVLLLDIDYFKSINDSYGHECGDRVLRVFARQVQRIVGDRGLVARMGGEEFAIVAATCDLRQGLRLAETIRQAVARHPFSWQQTSFHLTVSIGLGNGRVGENEDAVGVFNRLITEADEYLYRAKRTGRNRACARIADEAALTTRDRA